MSTSVTKNDAPAMKSNLKVKDRKYVEDLRLDVKRGLASINASLGAAVEPCRTIDYVVDSLTKQGETALVEKAVGLVNAIESDIRVYNGEIAELTPEVTTFLNEPPTRRRHLDRFSANGMYLGQRLLELNMRIMQTTMAIADDYSQILNTISDEVTPNE